MPKLAFSLAAVPSFEESPPVILITGDVGFFLEEASAQALERLEAGGAEVLRFDADAPLDAIADAILNRSLFSPRRIVCADVGRILGTETPASLFDAALEAWAKGTPSGRREAFRHARALLTALDVSSAGDAGEAAAAVAKKVRRKDQAPVLAEVLRDMPEEKAAPAVLQSALRLLLERGNDGTVALVTAAAAPTGAGLGAEIVRNGLVLDASVKKEDAAAALMRLARARAKEREVAVDADAVQRLLVQTDASPAMFASELDKLIAIAGPGGRVSASDVKQNVEDAASEDVYPFFDAVGRRDAADALARLDRILSDERPVRAGERPIDTDSYWPVQFLGMASTEVRRMLMIRSVLGDRFDARMSYQAFQARVLPRLEQAEPPFGRSPFANAQGQISGYLWYKAAQRASRFTVEELARSLARAADVDVALKNSTPPREVLTSWVAELIAGER